MKDYKLTPSAKNLIAKAIEIATKFKHKDLEVEHIIYAFCQIIDCKSHKLLEDLGVNLIEFSNFLLKEYFPSCRSYKDFSSVDIDFCLDLILEQSKIFAKSHNKGEINADIIFISILANLSIVSEDVLSKFDFDFEEYIQEMNDYFEYKTYPDIGGEQENKNSDDAFADAYKELSKSHENLNISCMTEDYKLIGREKEVFNLESALIRKDKSGIIVLGEEGVGKTSLVKYFAYKLAHGQCSYKSRGFCIFSINLNGLITGTKYRGEFEEKLENLIKIAQNPNVILFIDDFHNIVGAGSLEDGKSDAAEIIKPYLSNGKIRLIGATSHQDYKKYLEKNKSFCRRFQLINLKEPSKKETYQILKSKKTIYESHHNIRIKDSILNVIIDLSNDYLHSYRFPDKAIDLLDLSCARAMNDKTRRPKELTQQYDDFISSLSEDEEIDLDNLNKSQQKKYKKVKNSLDEWFNKCENSRFFLTEKDVIEILSEKTGIPSEKFYKNDVQKYLKLEESIKRNVFGQDEAINTICNCLLRYKVGLKDKTKPIGSFLFLGQTGVGKTYVSKILAKEFFADKNNFIKFDMSEYSDEASVTKLLGSSPGYVGHQNGSLLVDEISKRPHSVVVFDEIEKSHQKVQQVLLQILDEGNLTDSLGRKADFKNCIIIVTGNIGLQKLNKKESLGFSKDPSFDERKQDSMDELKKTLPLELLNRFDEIIYFNELNDENYKNIIKQELKNYSNILNFKSKNETNKIIYDESVVDYVFSKIKSENKNFGAREVKRIIQKNVLDNISSYILCNDKNKYLVEFSKTNKTIKIV